jgi:RNA polymerase sigma factor (sigma-70 family)
MKRAATIAAAMFGACCALIADALQSSSSFPPQYRQNHPHRYLDEGHPYTFDPNNFHIGSSTDSCSDELQMNKPHGGTPRSIQASIETDVTRDYSYQYYSSHDRIGRLAVIPTAQPQLGIKRRRKNKLAPRILRHSSILPTKRNHPPRPEKQAFPSSSSDLLTFDEEIEIAMDIQQFRCVTRARDNLLEWMSREVGWEYSSERMEPSETQLASACSLTIDRLRDVMTRGQDARARLIRGNVGLVTMTAKRYYNMLKNGTTHGGGGGGAAGTDAATLKLDDLVQEGYMGIMEAAERFDSTKGFRFSTYATHWIRQRIVRSIAESARIIRLPVHVQTMIRNMNKTTKEMEAITGRRPSMPELAHEMGIPLDKLHLCQHLSKNVLSLEQPVDVDDSKRTLGDRVACTEIATPDDDLMSESLRGEVHAMLDGLGHDERIVLTHRFGLDNGWPKSLRETAEGMGVSIDIVRRIEAKALNRLRQPRMNYRLRGFVGGHDSEELDHFAANEAQYHGWTSHTTTNYYDDEQQHHKTPESIWSF